MQKKQRSISKGVIEAKDKNDLKQHFSPNVTKRTGINLNTFLNSKPGMGNAGDGNLNQSREFLGNQTYNPGNTKSNFQNYKTNTSNIQQKQQPIPLNYSTNISGNNMTNYNSAINNQQNNSYNQKNIKLESIKNINTVIKKLKSTNISNVGNNNVSINSSQKLRDIQTKNTKKSISNLNSNNTNSLNMVSASSTNTALGGSQANISNFPTNQLNQGGQLNPVNLQSSMKKDLMPNLKSNQLTSGTFSGQLYQTNKTKSPNKLEKLNVYGTNQNSQGGSAINTHNISNISGNSNNKSGIKELKDLKEEKILKQDTNDLGKKTSHGLFSSEKERYSEKYSSNIEKDFSSKSENKNSTKDISSNNSTLNFKHSGARSVNGISVQLGDNMVHQSNIESPEDLHFFYVKMFQTNKEFASKFEKD